MKRLTTLYILGCTVFTNSIYAVPTPSVGFTGVSKGNAYVDIANNSGKLIKGTITTDHKKKINFWISTYKGANTVLEAYFSIYKLKKSRSSITSIIIDGHECLKDPIEIRRVAAKPALLRLYYNGEGKVEFPRTGERTPKIRWWFGGV